MVWKSDAAASDKFSQSLWFTLSKFQELLF